MVKTDKLGHELALRTIKLETNWFIAKVQFFLPKLPKTKKLDITDLDIPLRLST